MWATRRLNRTMAASTPAPTPIARLCETTMTTVVMTMTATSLRGSVRRVRGWMLCQSNEVSAT